MSEEPVAHAPDEGTPADASGAAEDYRIAGNSPCVNTGTNQSWMVGATDLAGAARIVAGVVDMGAYEFVPPSGTLIVIR